MVVVVVVAVKEEKVGGGLMSPPHTLGGRDFKCDLLTFVLVFFFSISTTTFLVKPCKHPSANLSFPTISSMFYRTHISFCVG